MNCLEFRRAKLADPRRLSAEAQAHLAGCAACAAFAREVDEAEHALEHALSVRVPEGLAERIVFRSQPGRPVRRAWLAAAAVALPATLGFVALRLLRKPDDSYARLAIEHVLMEPESFATTRNADPETFRRIVDEFGGTLNELPGELRYVRLCPLGDGSCWHVVFDTPRGLATLLLVPGRSVPETQTASSGAFSALARPVHGGYYAIVTGSAADTASFDELLRERIRWQA
jgi:hypothetical protein